MKDSIFIAIIAFLAGVFLGYSIGVFTTLNMVADKVVSVFENHGYNITEQIIKEYVSRGGLY